MNRHPQSDQVWDKLRVIDCVQCPLHETAKTVCLLGDGPVPCLAMIVGEAPGSREDDVEIPFSGKSGVYLRRMLKEIGLDPREIYISNVVACRPPANRTPTSKESKICSSLYLRPQLDLVKPKVILLLGNTAASWALGRKSAITKLEGSTFTLDGMTCVPSRHPSAVVRLEDLPERKDFLYAEQKFRENLLLFKRTLHPVKDDFVFEKNLRLVKEAPDGCPLYVDIETNGLDPFRKDAKIHCVSVAHIPSRVAAVRLTDENFLLVKEMLMKHPIIVHRGTFEGTWFRQHLGITPRLYHDTKLGAFVQNENENTGLKYQAIKNLNVEPWSEEQDWSNPDYAKLLPYNARDTQYGLRLYREQQLPFLKRNSKVARLLRYILLPSEEVFTEVIANGVHINVRDGKIKLRKVREEKTRINKAINKVAGNEVNPGSSKQMSRLFYDQLRLPCPVKTAKGKNSTSEAALIRLRGIHPVTDLLWDWRRWDKKESTYLIPWIGKGPVVHFNYGFTDTDTGRLNSNAVKNKRGEKKIQVDCPFCAGKSTCVYCEGTREITIGHGATIHQCPRDPFIRNLVTARDPDWCIVAADLSQAELRIIAHITGDPVMCEIFQHDPSTPEGDIHYQTAREFQPTGVIDKETRKKAKPVNFGLAFLMKVKKLILYALENYDVKMTKKEGWEYYRAFFKKYKSVGPWHRRVEAFVSTNGYMDSIFGRRRHLPGALAPSVEDCPDCLKEPSDDCFSCGGEGLIRLGQQEDWVRNEAIRQAVNSPVQSAASDLNLFIISLLLSQSLRWDGKIDPSRAFLVGSAHDSQVYECHRKYVPELKAAIINVLESLDLLTSKFFGFIFKVPIRMDVEAYEEWEGRKAIL